MYNVLIVDDSAYVRMLIKENIAVLENLNVVGEASNGLEAIRKFNDKKPDIVLLDITISGLDGIEVLKKIKEAKLNTKVMMISARGDTIEEAFLDGADDYIIKPYDVDTFKEKIEKLMEG